jgi:hypothetical protein
MVKSKWTAEELAELEDPANWDWGSAEHHPGNPDHESYVTLRFAKEEFRQLAQAARTMEVPLTEFIRGAALARAAKVRKGRP